MLEAAWQENRDEGRRRPRRERAGLHVVRARLRGALRDHVPERARRGRQDARTAGGSPASPRPGGSTGRAGSSRTPAGRSRRRSSTATSRSRSAHEARRRTARAARPRGARRRGGAADARRSRGRGDLPDLPDDARALQLAHRHADARVHPRADRGRGLEAGDQGRARRRVRRGRPRGAAEERVQPDRLAPSARRAARGPRGRHAARAALRARAAPSRPRPAPRRRSTPSSSGAWTTSSPASTTSRGRQDRTRVLRGPPLLRDAVRAAARPRLPLGRLRHRARRRRAEGRRSRACRSSPASRRSSSCSARRPRSRAGSSRTTGASSRRSRGSCSSRSASRSWGSCRCRGSTGSSAPELVEGARKRGSSALLGAAFGVCAAPCTGPVLAGILALAGDTGTVARGLGAPARLLARPGRPVRPRRDRLRAHDGRLPLAARPLRGDPHRERRDPRRRGPAALLRPLVVAERRSSTTSWRRSGSADRRGPVLRSCRRGDDPRRRGRPLLPWEARRAAGREAPARHHRQRRSARPRDRGHRPGRPGRGGRAVARTSRSSGSRTTPTRRACARGHEAGFDQVVARSALAERAPQLVGSGRSSRNVDS